MSSPPGLPPDAFLHAILDSVGVAFIVVDAQGRFVFTNQAALQMFGRTESLERVSVDRWRHDYVIRDSQGQPIPAEQASILRALAGEPVPPGEFDVTLPDGRRKWLHAAGQPFSIFGMAGVLAVITDETEQIQSRRASERARNAEALGLLVGETAHDLNNMLSIISAAVGLIHAEENVPEAISARLEQITVALQQGAALATRLVRHTRGHELHLRPIQINDLVDVALELARPLLKERVRVKSEFGSLPAVQVDRMRIEQVLVNLILNAIDAMPEGGELTLRTELVRGDAVVEIKLGEDKAQRATSYVCITVADTGIGIPESLQSQIFDPFFTTKPLGKGSGVGLASAYAVVKQHEGSITVQSAPQMGTKFSIYLPVRRNAAIGSKRKAA
jgi:two-component system, cell cycle sensor histidine kinase and response regulator CckA